MFPLYTKTFGGKIGNNLHSVSPDNILGKKFKMASLKIFPPKNMQAKSRAKKIESKTPIWPSTLRKPIRYFSQSLCQTFE